MKRILLLTFLCFILAVGMYHLGVFHFSWDCVSTLYTIVGIVFSVGMSLIISVSTREVKNKEAKKGIRRKMTEVTYSYILSFGLASILFILLDVRGNVLPENHSMTIEFFRHIVIWKSDFLVLTLCLYVLTYIGNFMAVQDMNREIEDIIDDERQ
jgi:hypothetical protein